MTNNSSVNVKFISIYSMLCTVTLTLPWSLRYRKMQSVIAFAPHAEGWVCSAIDLSRDSSTATRSAIGVSVTGPWRLPLKAGAPWDGRCGTLKNPHCSMAEHRSKFAAFHRYWWRLVMSEKFSSGTKNPKQKQNTLPLYYWPRISFGNWSVTRSYKHTHIK